MSSFDTIQRELFDGANYSPLPTINKPSSPKPDGRKFLKISEQARRTQRVNRALKKVGEGAGIKQRAIEDHLEILRNLGCEYLVVTDFDRTYVHGTKAQPAQPAKPKTKRSSPGTFSTHYKPLLDPLKVGDVASVPFKNELGVNLDPARLNSAISAYAATHWGIGAGTTFINRKTKAIEVLRKK